MMYDGDMDDKQNTLGLQLAGIDLIIEAFSALMELQGSEVRQTASGPSFWNWRDMNGRRDFSISPSPNIPGGHILTISQNLSPGLDSNLVYSIVITGDIIESVQTALTNATVIHSGAYAGLNSVVRVMATDGLISAMQRCAEIVGKTLSDDLHEITDMIEAPNNQMN